MHHRCRGRKFSRTPSHRKAMFKNLSLALLEHERINTTLPKAKDLRPVVEKYVTLARRGDLHARRQLLAALGNEELVAKLMGDLTARFQDRPGGYLRIMKNGFRYGDRAPMAIIEFVDYVPTAKAAPVVDEDEVA